MTKILKSLKLVCFHVLILCAAVVMAVLGCPVRVLLGISCPLCGTTHAWVSFLTGHVEEAFQYHPLFLITPFWFFLAVHYNTLFKKNKHLGYFLICIAVLLAVINLLRVICHESTLM